MSRAGGGPPGDPPAPDLLDRGSGSLLDAVDALLDRGALVTGDLVLGLADVDLIYLRLSTLLAAADRILGSPPGEPDPPGDGPAAPPPDGDPPDPQPGRAGSGTTDGPRPTEGPPGPGVAPAPRDDVDTLRHELERALGDPPPSKGDRTPRWNADPEDVERSVARLVLALVEFLRKLMERQAIRRMDEGTLTEGEVERLGRALMRLEETVHDLAGRFGIPPEDLNLDLGPLGTLS